MLFLNVKYFSIIDLLKLANLDNFETPEQFLSSPSIKNHSAFEEIKLFICSQNKESSVFNGWIEQNQPLKELLISGIFFSTSASPEE